MPGSAAPQWPTTAPIGREQLAEIEEWVEQGPEFERDGVVRWRCVDLQQRIKQEFGVQLH